MEFPCLTIYTKRRQENRTPVFCPQQQRCLRGFPHQHDHQFTFGLLPYCSNPQRRHRETLLRSIRTTLCLVKKNKAL